MAITDMCFWAADKEAKPVILGFLERYVENVALPGDMVAALEEIRRYMIDERVSTIYMSDIFCITMTTVEVKSRPLLRELISYCEELSSDEWGESDADVRSVRSDSDDDMPDKDFVETEYGWKAPEIAEAPPQLRRSTRIRKPNPRYH